MTDLNSRNYQVNTQGIIDTLRSIANGIENNQIVLLKFENNGDAGNNQGLFFVNELNLRFVVANISDT